MQTTTPTPSTGQQLPEVQNDLIYNWTVKRIVKFEGNEYVVASIPIKCVDFEWKNAHGKSARQLDILKKRETKKQTKIILT